MKPPRFAEWLLTHVAPGSLTDALAGDLAEEFSRRQSRTWYWRQVATTLATGLMPYVAVVPLWTAAVYYATSPILRGLVALVRRLAWVEGSSTPVLALIFVATTVIAYTAILATGLVTALAMAHNLHRRPFLIGLLWTAVTITLGDAVLVYLGPARPPGFHRALYAVTTCVALLLAVRTAHRARQSTRLQRP